MVEITTYSPADLTSGVCSECGQESNEIVVDDGRCVDCVEADKFYHLTMDGI